MYKLEWSVGVENLDYQHKGLFDLLTPMSSGNTIMELLEFIRVHFRDEEQYMRDTGYKGIEEHIVMHDHFTERVHIYAKQFLAGEDIDVRTFIQDWFITHILIEDKKYGNTNS